MTAQKDLKKIIRARQQKTGESYTSARAQVVRERAKEPAEGPRQPYEYHKIWIKQCEAAVEIREGLGLQSALSYIVGEKLLTFIGTSEKHAEFAAELPRFVSWLQRYFSVDELKSYLGSLRKTGISARLAPDGEVVFRRIGRKSRDPYNPIDRELGRLERARFLLFDAGRVN